MKEHHAEFRDKLVEAERFSPDLKQRYDKEIQSMFEKSISPARRIGMIGIIIVLAAKIMFFGYAVYAFDGLPMIARLGFVAGILFAASFITVIILSLRRGRIHLQKDPNRMTIITWLFLVVLTTIIMVMAGNMEDILGVKMLVNAMIFFMFGVVALVKNTIEQGTLKTREKILEVKYRIADLNEAIDNPSDETRR